MGIGGRSEAEVVVFALGIQVLLKYLEIAKAPLSPVVLNIAVRKDAARILNAASSFFWLEEGGSISVPSATIEQFVVARKT